MPGSSCRPHSPRSWDSRDSSTKPSTSGKPRAAATDPDSTVCETYGTQKAGGSRFTYTHVRGYHPLLAVLPQTGEVVHARLRGGPAHTAQGVARFIAQTHARVRGAGHTGGLTLRADAGFYSEKVVRACRTKKVRFSIAYPLPGAAVAELTYTPFAMPRSRT